jgi:dienelactone hydrolase
VIEQKIQIPTRSGTAEGVLYSPETESRWPGVIHYTDIGGIRASQQQMAQQLAGTGYVVLMPNIFYRTGELPLFDFPLKFDEERTTKRLAELSNPGGHHARRFGLRGLPGAAGFRQTRLDGCGGILLRRQDGALHRAGPTGQNSGGGLIARGRARHHCT